MKIRKLLASITLGLFAFLVTACDNSSTDPNSNDAAPDAKQPQASEQAKSIEPIVPVSQLADWCPEHGVPESICTRCNTSLIPAFKAKNDWDDQHGLPKSQCFLCDPSLKEKFVADYKEQHGKEPPAAQGAKH